MRSINSGAKRPFIRYTDLDNEAERYLRELYPIALQMPIAVPVAQIAAEIGLTMIAHEYLTEDFSIYGQMCFSDGVTDIYREESCEYVALEVKAGTMLIDPRTKWERNTGCFNNTVAHELFHWYRHRDYFKSQRRYSGAAIVATRCTQEQIEGNIKVNKKTDLDWIEWQASSIAPRILMPKDQFELVTMKSMDANKGRYRSGEAYFHQVVTDLASEFHVSRTSAAIRLKELGYLRRFK